LNADILYIKHLNKVDTQISEGIFKGFLYFVFNIALLILLGLYFLNFDKLTLLLPSGLIMDTKLQKYTHVVYFSLLVVEFVIVLPLVELRYYLILI